MWMAFDRSKQKRRCLINIDRVESVVESNEGKSSFVFVGEDNWICVETPYEEVVALLTDKTEQNLREMVEALRDDVKHMNDTLMSCFTDLVSHEIAFKEWREATGCENAEKAREMIESMKEANRELRADNMKEFQAGINHERVEQARREGKI